MLNIKIIGTKLKKNYKVDFFNYKIVDIINEKLKKGCLIVSISEKKYLEKTINDEILTALENKWGILVILSTKIYKEFMKSGEAFKNLDIPVRIKDNIKNNYVEIISEKSIFSIENDIENAMENSIRNDPNLFRKPFGIKRQTREMKEGLGIFISHQQKDKEKCKLIAIYLQQLGLDTYLDVDDDDIDIDDKKKLVSSINKNLKRTRDFLCILSNNTKLSKWVYYEVGMATAFEKRISSLALEDISSEDIPEFIQVNNKMNSKKNFKEHLKENFFKNDLEIEHYIHLNDNILDKIFA